MRKTKLSVVVTELAEALEHLAILGEMRGAPAIGRRLGLITAIDREDGAVGTNRDAVRPSDQGSVPVSQELAAAVEYLDSRIAAIGNLHAARTIERDAVRQIELTRP